ncbi:zinc-binding dehydrogenase [Pseudonocardia xinjiangensis]|uniref:Zinc-binding dehydrogenase n=1 Tax=Pseudonocardia xinjiangensis TaxID=75289 RepID=A0ABX1R7R1_9PSEU|nr:zinc-binding dehydrogenase [Pseudonocardia xinjiangensis]
MVSPVRGLRRGSRSDQRAPCGRGVRPARPAAPPDRIGRLARSGRATRGAGSGDSRGWVGRLARTKRATRGATPPTSRWRSRQSRPSSRPPPDAHGRLRDGCRIGRGAVRPSRAGARRPPPGRGAGAGRGGGELARELGATSVVSSRTADPVEAIRDLTGGGAGHVVESSGVPAVLVQAITSLRGGGSAAVVGVPPFGTTAPIDVADVVNNSKRIFGVVEGRSNPPTFLPDLAALVATGRLPVVKLVTTFALGEVEGAADMMRNGTATKPVLLPGEDA